jgi:hypothetical protein
VSEKSVPYWKLSMEVSEAAAELARAVNAVEQLGLVPEYQREAIKNGIGYANQLSGVLYNEHIKESVKRGEVW